MRLIDADAKELNQRITINFGAVTRFIVKSILKDAPTIDAVPVVRCKDCIYFHIADGISFGKCSKNGSFPYEDDFCSYGERKDGEG